MRRPLAPQKETMRFKPLEPTRKSRRLAQNLGWLCVLAMPAAGCDSDDSGALPGELGDNNFFYQCSTIDDAHCRFDLVDFPDKIALSSSFRLEARDGNSRSLDLKPVSPVMVTASGGEFRFRNAGFCSFVATDSFGDLIDFAHLRAVPVAEIGLDDALDEPIGAQWQLELGESTTITAVPLDEVGDSLAGSLSFRWASDDESVLTVERNGGAVTVSAVGEGSAELQVSLGDDLTRSVRVVVGAAPVGETSASQPTDAGVDAAADDGGTTPTDAGPTTQVVDAATDAGETSSTVVTDTAVDAATDAVSSASDAGPATQVVDAAADGGQQ